MNKRIFTTIIGLLLVSISFSQGFEAKFILGAAASQIDGDKYGGYNQVGGILGFATSFPVSDELAFQQEVSYYGRGSRKKGIAPASDVFTVLGMHYVDINGVLIYELDDILIHGGAGYGVLVYERTDAFTGGLDVYRPDLFILAGVGYKINEGIAVNARWQYSIRSMHRSIFPFHNNTLNCTFMFTIGGGK